MGVDIRKSHDADEFICIVNIGNADTEITGAEPYRSRKAAIDGLIMSHTIMHIFMLDMGNGSSEDRQTNVVFPQVGDRTRWSVFAGGKELVRCSRDFRSVKSAIENVAMVYVELSMFIASRAVGEDVTP